MPVQGCAHEGTKEYVIYSLVDHREWSGCTFGSSYVLET
jgi:hypothetical protein